MQTTATTANHPCLTPGAAAASGRVHLPVAPRTSARIRFASAAETPQALTPADAVAWLDAQVASGRPVDVVAITGPGDPLTAPGPTLETLALVRERHPGVALCLTTLGLGAEELAGELARLGVTLVTLLVDAVSPPQAEALYAWIRPGKKTVPLPEAARLLIAGQARALAALKEAGIAVKVNTTVYAGVNDGHVEDVAGAMAAMGADAMQVMPFSGSDEDWAHIRPGAELMERVRTRAARHLPLMDPKTECGATAEPSPAEGGAPALPKPSVERPNVAVCSAGGMDVDLHLGQAHQFLIYGAREGLVQLLEARPAPEPGTGASRWEAAAAVLSDCFALLAASAGESPRNILGRNGVRVLTCDGSTEGAVDALFGGGKKKGRGKGK